MILDAVLLAVRRIASTQQRDVAIIPEMRLGQGDGVRISHPISGYELWLSGKVDYTVIEYENVKDYKGESEYQLLHKSLHDPSQPAWLALVDPERSPSG
jgi:hypothetical protein